MINDTPPVPVRSPLDHLAETVPPKYHGVYKRAISGSRTSAIKAMCLECQGWSDGAARAVKECVSVACPLHKVRPYQHKDEQEEHDDDHGEQTAIEDIDRVLSPAELDARLLDLLTDKPVPAHPVDPVEDLRSRRIEALKKARSVRAQNRQQQKAENEP